MLSYGVVALLIAVLSWMAGAAPHAPQLCENFFFPKEILLRGNALEICSQSFIPPCRGLYQLPDRGAFCLGSSRAAPFRVTPEWRTGLIDTESRSGQG